MIQIRKGVFETNSSSTHTIALDTSDIDAMSIVKEVHFGLESFGWDFSLDNSTANYLWTAIMNILSYHDQMIIVGDRKLRLDDIISLIKGAFSKYGIKASFDVVIGASIYMSRDRDINGVSYEYPEIRFNMSFTGGEGIDHGDDLYDFVVFMLQDPDNIVKFVLNKNSVVITGNDNSNTPEDIQETIDELTKDKKTKIFKKWN